MGNDELLAVCHRRQTEAPLFLYPLFEPATARIRGPGGHSPTLGQFGLRKPAVVTVKPPGAW